MVQDIMDNKISLSEARMMAIMHENEVYKYFDEGNTRYVFANEDESKVIKLCKERMSNMFNEQEAKIYENASDEDKTQMANTKMINGFIEQEFCLPIKWSGEKLNIKQRRFSLSCRDEVGFNKDGELVCFDLDEFKKY